MTTYPNGRSIADDPQPGDKAHRREHSPRVVEGRFIDAIGEPYVIYSVQHRIPLKSWRKWVKTSGASIK